MHSLANICECMHMFITVTSLFCSYHRPHSFHHDLEPLHQLCQTCYLLCNYFIEMILESFDCVLLASLQCQLLDSQIPCSCFAGKGERGGGA